MSLYYISVHKIIFIVVFFFFCSGNNAPPYGTRHAPGSTNGLRGRKHDIWEGGIREPTIIEWNGMIKNEKGFNSTFPIVTYDFMTTILDVLNIKTSSKWSLDGISLLPMFKNHTMIKKRDKPIGWQYYRSAAWMDNEWKLVLNSKNGELERDTALYNIESDPFETNNLMHENVHTFHKMRQELKKWLRSVNQSQYHDSECAFSRKNRKIEHIKRYLNDLLDQLSW